MSYKRLWEIKQDAEHPDILEIYVYGYVEDMTYDYTEWCYKESENSANAFRKVLDESKGATQINIHINSWGGDVIEGNAIYNLLRRHPANKTVYIDAFACSIASVIAMSGDKIIMPRNAMMMIHNMAWGCYGNSADLRKAADDLDIINEAGKTAYLDKAGEKLDEAKLSELMDAEAWLTAEKCFELGLCDEIEQRDANMAEASEIVQRMNKHMEQRIETYRSLAASLRQLVGIGKSAAPTADARVTPSTPLSEQSGGIPAASAGGEPAAPEPEKEPKPTGLLSRFKH